MEKWDGHTHTEFCRHGSSARMEEYVERAIALGFTRYSLTEHPPLPDHWVNNEPLMAELAMNEQELAAYFDEALAVKRKYAERIEITVGLELDYLHGRTDYTNAIVERWKPVMEDAVVSVHYLPGAGGMRCLDFTPDDFKEGLLDHYGTMDRIVDAYFDHVELAIAYASGLPMRKRIGHLLLIEKFRTALPPIDPEQLRDRLSRLLPLLAAGDVGVDVNTAGLRVPTCGQVYVPAWFIGECRKRGIACVYGSDAHKPDVVGFGWDAFAAMAKGTGR